MDEFRGFTLTTFATAIGWLNVCGAVIKIILVLLIDKDDMTIAAQGLFDNSGDKHLWRNFVVVVIYIVLIFNIIDGIASVFLIMAIRRGQRYVYNSHLEAIRQREKYFMCILFQIWLLGVECFFFYPIYSFYKIIHEERELFSHYS